jgi:CysZ protein
MIKAIQLHLDGIRTTAETLGKGKFLVFFLPGFIIGIIALYFSWRANNLLDAAHAVDDIPLVGSILSYSVDGIFGFFGFIANEFYKFLLLVCLSPVNCILSEKYDNYLTNNKFEGGLVRIINDVLRAILIVTIVLLMEYITLFVWWILTFLIPMDEYLTPIVQFLISAFFLGFAFYDYSLERYQKSTLSSLGFSFSNMGIVVLTGALFSALYTIPYIGIIIAPVLLTMISTVVYVRKFPSKTTQSDQQDH